MKSLNLTNRIYPIQSKTKDQKLAQLLEEEGFCSYKGNLAEKGWSAKRLEILSNETLRLVLVIESSYHQEVLIGESIAGFGDEGVLLSIFGKIKILYQKELGLEVEETN